MKVLGPRFLDASYVSLKRWRHAATLAILWSVRNIIEDYSKCSPVYYATPAEQLNVRPEPSAGFCPPIEEESRRRGPTPPEASPLGGDHPPGDEPVLVAANSTPAGSTRAESGPPGGLQPPLMLSAESNRRLSCASADHWARSRGSPESPGLETKLLANRKRSPKIGRTHPAEEPQAEPDGIDMRAWEEAAKKVRPRIARPDPPELQRNKVRTVLQRLDGACGEPDANETAALLKELDVIAGKIPNADDFVAGNFAHNRAAWEEMLREQPTRAGRRVLSWLIRGFRPTFGDPAHAKPDKKKIVNEMLRKAYPGREPAEFLTGDRPHRVAFKKHRSFYRHWSFSSAELLKLLLWEAIEIAEPEDGTVVTVENPLGVADQDGKQRLFLNGRYVNIFLKELPFQYQRLRDVLLFLEKESFMSTLDLKSGYYHVFLHPSFRQYMGFRVGNLVFRYTVPAFGLSQACFLFTKLMNEPAKALRFRGVPVSDYIDDGFSGARTFARCLFQVVGAVLLLGALGAFLGMPKCHVLPEQIRQWFGFLVNSVDETFELSPSRLAKLKRQLMEVRQASHVTARALASLAGRIVSASPAVLPASLYSRPLFEAISGRLCWDAFFPNQESVKETALFWLKKLDRFNGRPWRPAPVNLRATVDASGLGFGGTLSAGESDPVIFRGTFSAHEAGASSTARELSGYLGALRVAAYLHASKLRGSSLLITGDSQSATSDINRFRSSNPVLNRLLRQMFDLCLEAGCDIQAQWVPREHITLADAISREPDASDWGLDPAIVKAIIRHFNVRISADLFASATHHVSVNFVSKFYEPGCTAVQALRLDWRTILDVNQSAWVFPPTPLTGAALDRIRTFKINAIFVGRACKASNEMLLLCDLPGAFVSEPYVIAKASGSCHPSLRVPAGTINPAKFLGLHATYIKWK